MFSELMTIDRCKDLYRKLAFRLHPDHGGSNELMIILQKSYDKQIAFLLELDKLFPDDEEEDFYEKVYEKVYRLDHRLSIMEEIDQYAQSHSTYDSTFFHSVKQFLNHKGYITPNQYNALVKVYYAFEMHLKDKKG